MHRIALLACAVVMVGCKGVDRPPTPITTKVTLRYHPPAGAVYRYQMDQTSSFGPDSGADTGGVNTMRIAFTQTIGTPDADGVPVTFTFDSTKLESPMLNPAAADQATERLKSVHLTTVYDDHLRPVHNDVSSLSGLPPLVRDQMQVGFRAAALALPDQPVGPGDSWTNATELPVSAIGGTPFTVHSKVTVREISVSRGDTTVRLAIETALPAEPMQFALGGQQFTVALKGAITGEQVLSLTRGAIVSAALGGTMHVAVSGGFFGAPGMKVRVQQQGTLKLVS
ncbi:MAG TPA: hypothetical protein VFP39_11800 [Gemmatimonadales bacterium]|nr:hypothetical protein [Gemmatimonadales bacterium]